MKWQPDGFTLEMTSVWSFPQRGKWATHDGKYRGKIGLLIFHAI